MNRSVPAGLHVWPGVSPWTTGSAGAVEQADSRAGARRTTLRIDRLVFRDSAHLELAVLDREGESPFDKVERVLAELLIAPAGKDIEVLAHSGGERLELVGAGDQARCNPGLLGPDLEQKLQEVADQRRVLGKARVAWLAIRHLARLERTGGGERSHQPGADVIGLPPRREAADPAQVFLGLGRVKDD